MNRRAIMLSVVVVAFAVFAAAAWFTTRPASVAATATVPPEQSEALLRSYSPILGPEDAPVTIVEFFDPACEACRAFYPVVKDIMEEHGDAVRSATRRSTAKRRRKRSACSRRPGCRTSTSP